VHKTKEEAKQKTIEHKRNRREQKAGDRLLNMNYKI
jgi:hypothetical protein